MKEPDFFVIDCNVVPTDGKATEQIKEIVRYLESKMVEGGAVCSFGVSLTVTRDSLSERLALRELASKKMPIAVYASRYNIFTEYCRSLGLDPRRQIFLQFAQDLERVRGLKGIACHIIGECPRRLYDDIYQLQGIGLISEILYPDY